MCLHINVLEIARTKLLFVVLDLRNFLSVGLEIARTVHQTNTTKFSLISQNASWRSQGHTSNFLHRQISNIYFILA